MSFSPRSVRLGILLTVVIVLCHAAAFAQAFVHPGCLSTTNDFARMAAKVQAGAHPWIDSYNILIGNGAASSNAVSHAQPILQRGSGGGACLSADNYQFAYWDTCAAYQLSLRWQITGDNNYANTAVNILNAWANTCTNLCGDPNVALLGLYGYQFACAAENLRTYTNWTAADFSKFQSWMTNVWYPLSHSWLSGHFGACPTHAWANWDLCNMNTVLAIGVLCDRRDIYNEAINYYTNGPGAGAANQVMPFSHPGYLGQCQESGRDQGHCTLDPILLSVFCEISWNQGDDMYGYKTNELLQISEYVSKFNVEPLANNIPFVAYFNCEYFNWNTEAHGLTRNISYSSWGTVRPGWNLIYNHYVNRRGLSAPWTGLMAGEVNAEGGGGNYGSNSGGYDQLGFTTLTHTLDPIAIASVPAPSLLLAQPRNNTITLSWFGSAHAGSYNVKRATAPAGPYTNIASVPMPSFSYVDAGLTQGTIYYYEVSAVVNGAETTNSAPVSAMPNTQLTGTVIGTPGSYNSGGADASLLFDGAVNTCYDAANSSGDWGGLDLGTSNVITQVAYFPRANNAGRMVGGQLQAANVPDFSSGVATLFTITNQPTDGVMTYQAVSNSGTFRYVRYIGPANGSCNASEIQFYGAPPAPVPPAAPLNLQATAGNAQAVLAWSEADTAMSYNVKRATVSGGPYIIIATNVLTTTFTDTGLSNFANYYYVVSAINGAGEGNNSVEVSVVPSPGYRAGSLCWTGATNANWDTTTLNWAANFQPLTYANGNSVLFDDSASLVSVSIPSSLSPTAVTFNNYSKGYMLSGSPISGSCALTLLGTSWVLLNSANSFTGGVTIDAGNLTVGNANALGSGTVTLNGGMLNNSAGISLPNNIIVSTNGGAIQLGSANNLTLNGTVSGNGPLILGSDGNSTSLYLAGNNAMGGGSITVANWNNYVRFASANAGNANADWIFNNTAAGHTSFDFATGTIAFGSMSGAGIIQGNVNGANSMNVTIQAGGDNNSSTFSGVLHDNRWGTGPIGLKKVGAGILFLSGACDYSGQTTVTNGELIISTAFASKSTCLITNGATFGVTNSSSVSGTISNLTLAAGTTLELINVTSLATPLLLASNIVVGGSCTVKITEPGSLNPGNYPLINYSGTFSGTFSNLLVQLPASVTNSLVGSLVSNANQIVLSVAPTMPPMPPSTLTAGAGNSQVALNWSVALGATGYNVWRSTTSGTGYSLAGSTAGLGFTDTGLINNQNYYYVVTATNSYGSSGYSPQASATPHIIVVWTGATNASWDFSTTNWTLGGAPAVYQNADVAAFNDGALSNVTINIPSPVSPQMIIVSNYVQTYTFLGSPITGTGSLNKWGSYPLYLGGANTYSGGTINNFGYIILSASTTGSAGNVTSGPLGTGPVTMSGGYLSSDTSARTLANALVAAAGTTSTLGAAYTGGNANFYLTGALSGSGSFQNDPATPAGSYSIFFQGDLSGFTGTLNYHGVTGGNGANWRVGVANSMADLSHASVTLTGGNAKNFGFPDNSSGVVVNLGSLSGSGYFQGSYFGSGNGSGNALQLGFLDSNTIFTGQMGVSGNSMANFNIVKVGSGTQWLIGTNIYNGLTTVSNGELVISTVHAGNGNFWVTNGAALGVTNLSGTSALVSNITLAAGTILDFQGISSTSVPLVLASNVTVGGSCTVKLTGTGGLSAGAGYPLIGYAGVLNGTFTNLQLQMPYGWRGALANIGKQIVLTNVAVVATTPPQVNANLNNGQLQINWPVDHTGWRLLMQTNLANTNWLNVAGTAVTNLASVPATNGSLFFRLTYP